MMTLERLLSFYKHSNWPRYAAIISRPIIAKCLATRPEHGSCVLKRTVSLQAPPDTWPHTQNVNLVFNRAASLQQGKVRVSSTNIAFHQYSQARVWVKQESYVSTLIELCLFNTVRVASPLDIHVSSTLDEVCVSLAT